VTGRRRSRWSRPAKASTVPGALNMAETKLQSKVQEYAVRKGLLHYHTHNSERSEAGFPDSVIVGNWVMYRELKSDSDSAAVSKEQRKWIQALEAVGVDVDVWWPIDWEKGRIQEEMNACAKTRKPDGQIAMPNVAKTLYLFADDRPSAGVLWDAGARGIDRVTWERHAASLMRTMAHALPSGDEEILAWLAHHHLGAGAGAGAIIEALRGDLARTKGVEFFG